MMMATARGEGVYTPLQLLPQLAIRSAAGFSIAARSCFVAAGAGTPASVVQLLLLRLLSKGNLLKTYAITTATAALNETIGHPFTGALVTGEPSVIHVMIVSPCGSTIDENLFQ